MQAQQGLVSRGVGGRLEAFVHKLINGETVSVAAVGGSITVGQGTKRRGQPGAQGSYVQQAYKWLHAAFTRDHRFRNGAVPATKSSYMELCLRWHVDAHADIAIVEYALNDGGGAEGLASMERLVRKLLALPGGPAVLLVNMFPYAAMSADQGWDFRAGPDAAYQELARYYHLPVVSMREATFAAAAEQLPGFLLPPDGAAAQEQEDRFFVTADKSHPNQRGHGMLAQMIVHLLQDAVTEAVLYPREPPAPGPAPLPPPMLPGNHATATVGCYYGASMEPLVAAKGGWDFSDDGKPGRAGKVGLASTAVGDTMELALSTEMGEGAEGARPEERPRVDIAVGFLRSYEKMGVVHLSCSGGCACACSPRDEVCKSLGTPEGSGGGEVLRVDGLWIHRQSQTHVVHISATQAPRCVLRFMNAGAEDRLQHKVKINSIMLSHSDAGMPQTYFDFEATQPTHVGGLYEGVTG